jgi:hypothetical protein
MTDDTGHTVGVFSIDMTDVTGNTFGVCSIDMTDVTGNTFGICSIEHFQKHHFLNVEYYDRSIILQKKSKCL